MKNKETAIVYAASSVGREHLRAFTIKRHAARLCPMLEVARSNWLAVKPSKLQQH